MKKKLTFKLEEITDVDYLRTKRVCKDFEIKYLGEYHDLHVQSNTLLLADVIENFRNTCLEIYEDILENFFHLLG